jgi:putative thioredoxin
MTETPHVTEATADNFDAVVLARSHEVPVVLDFWAAWCQPCRMLGPLLEEAAKEFDGQFELVKADVDQLPQHAAAFGVQGIPAVYALRDGNVVDSFAGLLTESQLREWLRGVLPSEADKLVKQAMLLEVADPSQAEALFRQAIAAAPNLPEAKIGLARVLIALNDRDSARAVLDELNERGFLEPEAQRLLSELEIGSHRLSSDELSQLATRSAESPNDPALKLQWAEALLAAGSYEEGLQRCLEVVELGPGAARDEARARMVDTFRVLGDDNPLTSAFRRKLTLALY